MRHALLHVEMDPRRRVARLRAAAESERVGVIEETGIVVVFRHDDVRRLLHDPRLTGTGLAALDIANAPLRAWYDALLHTNETLNHRRRRRVLLARAFATVAVDRIRRQAASSVSTAIAPLVGNGGDLVAALRTLPMAVMCDLLGIPPSMVPECARWADDLGPVFATPSTEQVTRATAAIDPLMACIGEIVEDRGRTPGDDLISALLHAELDGELLGHADTVAMVLNLLTCGPGTTASQIGCSLFTLLQRNDVTRLAIAEPDLIPSIVTETIRFEPSLDGALRRAAVPLDICDEPFPAGSLVMLCTMTANRDPSVWSDAHQLQPHRFMATPSPELLTFGSGSHHGLGAALARVTLTETIRAVGAHMPILLADPAEVEWVSTNGRGPARLPVMM